VSHTLQLAQLSPEIIHLALIGALPEHITLKFWGIYNQIRTHSPFCKRLIIKHSQVTHKLQMVIHSFSELHSPRQW
jgi:hypothetical protein